MIIYTIPTDTGSLLDMFSFVASGFMGLVPIALIVMKVGKKYQSEEFKVRLKGQSHRESHDFVFSTSWL